MATSSFLGLEGLHVFVAGAAGGTGERLVGEFLGKFTLVTGDAGHVRCYPWGVVSCDCSAKCPNLI